jgi:hypothetical protein
MTSPSFFEPLPVSARRAPCPGSTRTAFKYGTWRPIRSWRPAARSVQGVKVAEHLAVEQERLAIWWPAQAATYRQGR